MKQHGPPSRKSRTKKCEALLGVGDTETKTGTQRATESETERETERDGETPLTHAVGAHTLA